MGAWQIGHEQIVRRLFIVIAHPAVGGDDLQLLASVGHAVVQDRPLVAVPPISSPAEDEIRTGLHRPLGAARVRAQEFQGELANFRRQFQVRHRAIDIAGKYIEPVRAVGILVATLHRRIAFRWIIIIAGWIIRVRISRKIAATHSRQCQQKYQNKFSDLHWRPLSSMSVLPHPSLSPSSESPYSRKSLPEWAAPQMCRSGIQTAGRHLPPRRLHPAPFHL